MGRHGLINVIRAINWMVQKIKEIYYRSVKRRVASKRRVAGQMGVTMNSVCRLRIFAGCENFSQPGKFSGKIWLPPALEHLQQHKTKNYEKISLKMRKFTNFENLRILMENPNLKLEIM